LHGAARSLGRLVRLALPGQLVPPALRAHKVSKDRSVRKARRGKPVAKAQSGLQANGDHQARRGPLAHPDLTSGSEG